MSKKLELKKSLSLLKRGIAAKQFLTPHLDIILPERSSQNGYLAFTPLHQPYNIKAIEIISKSFPKLPQITCFDTAYHRTHPPVADCFRLPRNLTDAGIMPPTLGGRSEEASE